MLRNGRHTRPWDGDDATPSNAGYRRRRNDVSPQRRVSNGDENERRSDNYDGGYAVFAVSEATMTRSDATAPKRAGLDLDLDEYMYAMGKDYMRPTRLPRDLDREPDCAWDFPLEPNEPRLIEPVYPDYDPG
jgi:hypothetical protein